MQVEPKKTFQANRDLNQWFQDVVATNNWQLATAFALADFSMRGPTTDEMRGAVAFLSVLTNLGEVPADRKDPGFNLQRQPSTK